MKAIEQRIAIARSCGMVRDWDYILETYQQFRNRDDGGEAIFTLSKVPDYLNDLNAMHEAEKVLTIEQHWTFMESIREQIGFQKEFTWSLCHATAAQRAEALLKTLGLWIEEPASESTVEGLR